MEGLKGGGEEVKILPPLFIYGEEGGYSGEMQGIFNALPDRP